MNCSRYHYLLSLNLDGRLSSGRHDDLLDHLADCGSCAQLAEDMRATQDQALGLNTDATNTNFRDTLWDRIEAGEGSPEGAFYEPVPLAARIRYVASGAAAAALFLVALNWTAEGPASIQPRHEILSQAQHDVTQRGVGEQPERAGTNDTKAEPASLAARFGPKTTSPKVIPTITSDVHLVGAFTPNPTNVAQLLQETAVRSLDNLQFRNRQFLANNAETITVTADYEQSVRKLRDAAYLMQWMVDQDFIMLPTDLQTELRLAEHGASLFERASDEQTQRFALQQISGLSGSKLKLHFSVICCDTEAKFRARFEDQLCQNPRISCVFRLNVIKEGLLPKANPVWTGVLPLEGWIRSPSDSVPVTPKPPAVVQPDRKR